MKVVTDIDDNLYTRLFNNGDIDAVDMLKACVAIRKGTPLPKGHGRLIDADELTKQLETVASDEWNKQVGASKGLEDAVDIVDDAPTIIEADKAEGSEDR